MDAAKVKKALVRALPFLFIFWIANKLVQSYRLATGANVVFKVLGAISGFGAVMASPLPSLHPWDLLGGLCGAALIRLALYCKAKNARKYRKGREYGSACFGTAKDIEPFIDKDFHNNVILTETERLTLGQISDPEKRNVNLNVLVIGGSGSGKTRYHIKPNLLQMYGSYVTSDPKGYV